MSQGWTMKRLMVIVVCAGALVGCNGSAKRGAEDPSPTASAPAVARIEGEPESPTSQPSYAGHTLLTPPEVVEAVVLTVNDQAVTINDVLDPLRRRLRAVDKGGGEEAFRVAAREMIVEEIRRQVYMILVLAEAERELSEQAKAYVEREADSRLRDMIAETGGSQSKLDQTLKEQGSSLPEQIEKLRRTLTVGVYEQRKFTSQLGATREQLWRYYQTHKDEFSQAAAVKMQILAIAYEDTGGDAAAARHAARIKAAEALMRIESGEDFGQVVRETSNSEVYGASRGGVSDYIQRGSLVEEEVESAAFDQGPGKVSTVIEGRRGMFIVKTLDLRPGKVTSFTEAQEGIRRRLHEEQYRKLADENYRRLYKKAVILQARDFERLTLARAVTTYYRR